MKPIELARCLQYAKNECEKLREDALLEGVEIDFNCKAYDTTMSYMGYGIRFYVSFFGITEEYFTGDEKEERELKARINEQIARIRREIL